MIIRFSFSVCIIIIAPNIKSTYREAESFRALISLQESVRISVWMVVLVEMNAKIAKRVRRSSLLRVQYHIASNNEQITLLL